MTRTPARATQARLLTKAEAAASRHPRRGVKFKITQRESIRIGLDQKGREFTKIEVGDPVLYVVGFADYVKIGFSRNLPERLRMLQCHAPERIKVYTLLHGLRGDEKRFQEEFAEYRLEGEWFRRTGRLRVWINELALRERKRGAA